MAVKLKAIIIILITTLLITACPDQVFLTALYGTWEGAGTGGTMQITITFTDSQYIRVDTASGSDPKTITCDYIYTNSTYSISNCDDSSPDKIFSYSINQNALTVGMDTFINVNVLIGTWRGSNINGLSEVTIKITNTQFIGSSSGTIGLACNYNYNSNRAMVTGCTGVAAPFIDSTTFTYSVNGDTLMLDGRVFLRVNT